MRPDVFCAVHPELDPMGKAAFMPLGRYLEKWWRATDARHRHGNVLPATALRRVFEQVLQDNLGGEAEAGPIGAALKATAVAGWQVENATAFVSPRFGRISAMEHGPKRMEYDYLEDVLDRARERATDSVRRREGLSEQELPDVWWEAVAIAVASKRTTPLEKLVPSNHSRRHPLTGSPLRVARRLLMALGLERDPWTWTRRQDKLQRTCATPGDLGGSASPPLPCPEAPGRPLRQDGACPSLPVTGRGSARRPRARPPPPASAPPEEARRRRWPGMGSEGASGSGPLRTPSPAGCPKGTAQAHSRRSGRCGRGSRRMASRSGLPRRPRPEGSMPERLTWAPSYRKLVI